MSPSRPCLEVGCPEFAAPKGRGRCKDCATKREQSINRVGKKVYRSKKWQLTRRKVLFEEPMCRLCVAEQIQELAEEVDHINGDPTDQRRENLMPLCKPHHSAKTRREQAA